MSAFGSPFGGDASSLGGAPASAYLRSDVADTATGLITFANSGDNEKVRVQGSDGFISFFDGTATRRAFIQARETSSELYLRSEMHGATIRIQGEDAGGAVKNIFAGNPNTSVDLYHAGSLRFRTSTDRVEVIGTSTGNANVANLRFLQSDGTNEGAVGLRSNTTRNVELRAEAGKVQIVPVADATELFHAGAKVVETASSGINFGTGVSGSNRGRLTNNGTDTFLISDVNSGKMQIQSKSSGGVGRNLAILDPDGAATLYHAGTARLATTTIGAEISGTGTGNANISVVEFDQSDGTRDGVVGISSGSSRAIRLQSDAGDVELHSVTAAVKLNHAGTTRLATTSTGISISGGPTLTYEEGTWTPTLTFATPGDLSVVYSSRVGEYEKVGRQVILRFTIITSTFTFTTASGNLTVTGLPFTSAGSGFRTASAVGTFENINLANMANVSAFVGASTTSMIFTGPRNNGSTAINIQASHMASGTRVILEGQITYRV